MLDDESLRRLVTLHLDSVTLHTITNIIENAIQRALNDLREKGRERTARYRENKRTAKLNGRDTPFPVIQRGTAQWRAWETHEGKSLPGKVRTVKTEWPPGMEPQKATG